MLNPNPDPGHSPIATLHPQPEPETDLDPDPGLGVVWAVRGVLHSPLAARQLLLHSERAQRGLALALDSWP